MMFEYMDNRKSYYEQDMVVYWGHTDQIYDAEFMQGQGHTFILVLFDL